MEIAEIQIFDKKVKEFYNFSYRNIGKTNVTVLWLVWENSFFSVGKKKYFEKARVYAVFREDELAFVMRRSPVRIRPGADGRTP